MKPILMTLWNSTLLTVPRCGVIVGSAISVDRRWSFGDNQTGLQPTEELVMVSQKLDVAFHPRSIAVVGASGTPSSMGYRFVLHLLNYGYRGRIYPVTPNWSEVLGLKTYPTLKDIPGTVDYVICCLPAPKVSELLSECPPKGVQVVHLYTARFSETGSRDAAELETRIWQQARKVGIRLIGPNCMGIYHPREGIAFGYDFPAEPGKVGWLSQSGGAAAEFIHYASLRGIRFSKVVSYGNALDLNEADYLEYFTQDSETEVIVSHVEGVKDGRRFLSALGRASRSKPVIILKAGRSSAGARSAASHTGALAGAISTWEAAIRQAGAIPARSLKDLINLTVSFSFLLPLLGTRVGIYGGSGGICVLSADGWEEAGFNVVPLPPEIEREIEKVVPELWRGWIRNPVDGSIFPEQARESNLAGNIPRMMAQSSYFDLIVANISMGAPSSGAELASSTKRVVENIIDIKRNTTKPLAVVLDTGTLGVEDFDNQRWRCLAEAKANLARAQIPFYATTEDAAGAIIQLVSYYQRRELSAKSVQIWPGLKGRSKP